MLSINIRAAERVVAVTLTINGEHITVMEAHAGKHEHRTRVKYIKFTSNFGRSIEGGTQTDKIGTDTAMNGFQFGGFDGRSGDELDLVSAIWTSIQPVA
ncbi:putative secreted protein [Phytophthora infestans]|uniref:Putative secreted protein n=1 Tax=Phytophthora infestans TaxID=4787 RepID=A0A833SZZ7_PHYIN|nr:putative secreted protein [Phytophthora infestans]